MNKGFLLNMTISCVIIFDIVYTPFSSQHTPNTQTEREEWRGGGVTPFPETHLPGVAWFCPQTSSEEEKKQGTRKEEAVTWPQTPPQCNTHTHTMSFILKPTPYPAGTCSAPGRRGWSCENPLKRSYWNAEDPEQVKLQLWWRETTTTD